jgi:hypothetical protein
MHHRLLAMMQLLSEVGESVACYTFTYFRALSAALGLNRKHKLSSGTTAQTFQIANATGVINCSNFGKPQTSID